MNAGPDFGRMLLDRRLGAMDTFILGIYSLGKRDMFPTMAKIISRAEWGAQPSKSTRELKTPVEHLIVTWTYTDSCTTKDECIKAVQNIQKTQMEKGDTDIEYNFLIGGDGYLYEGRGWKGVPTYAKELKAANRFRGNSIKVAFISKPTNKPSILMLKAVATIFAIGEAEKYVTKTVKYSRIVNDEVMSFTI